MCRPQKHVGFVLSKPTWKIAHANPGVYPKGLPTCLPTYRPYQYRFIFLTTLVSPIYASSHLSMYVSIQLSISIHPSTQMSSGHKKEGHLIFVGSVERGSLTPKRRKRGHHWATQSIYKPWGETLHHFRPRFSGKPSSRKPLSGGSQTGWLVLV